MCIHDPTDAARIHLSQSSFAFTLTSAHLIIPPPWRAPAPYRWPCKRNHAVKMAVLEQKQNDAPCRDRRVIHSSTRARTPVFARTKLLPTAYTRYYTHIHTDDVVRYMAPEMVDKREESAGYGRVRDGTS